MDNSVERDKRIEEIYVAKERADNLSEYITEDIDKADDWLELLISEVSRLQVERDKAIEERDELLYELREAQERGSLD